MVGIWPEDLALSDLASRGNCIGRDSRKLVRPPSGHSCSLRGLGRDCLLSTQSRTQTFFPEYSGFRALQLYQADDEESDAYSPHSAALYPVPNHGSTLPRFRGSGRSSMAMLDEAINEIGVYDGFRDF